MNTPPFIEPLESRIAPATTLAFVSSTTATYSDVDGDLVTVTFSKDILNDTNFDDVLKVAASGPVGGEQLTKIDITVASSPGGTSVTIKAEPDPMTGRGDGLANVGYIDATGIDLGAVKVPGDLGELLAGAGAVSPHGVKSLSVASLGRFGTNTGAPGLETTVNGKLGSLTVTGDITGAVVTTSFLGAAKIGGALTADSVGNGGRLYSEGDMGMVKIGGEVRGGSVANSGKIISNTGKIAAVKVGGSLVGGGGMDSGQISSGGDMGRVTIGGSVIGGANFDSGEIFSVGAMGTVKIGGDVRGSGPSSGIVYGSTKIASLSIGGSLLGGGSSSSGEIISDGELRSVKIAGDVRGGSIVDPNPSLDSTGYIQGAHIGSVFIGGSIVAGSDTSDSGQLTKNASIRAANDIGSITVLGSLVGNVSPTGGDTAAVAIVARGKASLPATNDVAIGKITVAGRVERAAILAGYDLEGVTGTNADAQIGTVTVGGDWIASNLIAGVAAGTNGFGNSDDVKISGALKDIPDNGGSGAISRIASVIIKGGAFGTLSSGDAAVFGIEAQQLGKIKVGNATVPLTTGVNNDLFADRHPLGPTLASGNVFDFHAFEVGVDP